MRSARALGAQSPAVLISLLALVFSLGGGAYAAAEVTSHPSQPAVVVSPAVAVKLHALRLVHGWKPAPQFHAGVPSYGISNGVVYLSGGMYQPIAGKPSFAALPLGFRPATNVFITVSVYEGLTNFGTLFITPNGVMQVYAPSGAASPASSFTSLAGVSFPLGS